MHKATTCASEAAKRTHSRSSPILLAFVVITLGIANASATLSTQTISTCLSSARSDTGQASIMHRDSTRMKV